MSEWQSIETAPKDGSCILVWSRTWAGEVNRPEEDNGSCYVAFYTNGKSDYHGEWWYVHGGDAHASWVQPTHWMPLPTPPEETR